MKRYIFPVSITLLGCFTAYVFYALWHSEAVVPNKSPTAPKEVTPENLSNKEHKAKDGYTPSPTPVKNVEKVSVKANLTNLSPEDIEMENEVFYETVMPEQHAETMEEASTAFEALDTYVDTVNNDIEEELQAIEMSLEDNE